MEIELYSREPLYNELGEDRSKKLINRSLIVENYDGSEVVRLTNEIIGSPVYYNDVVTWSPDNSKVVCLSNLNEQYISKEKQLCIININDHTISQITSDNTKKEVPLYSPVSNKIIFLSDINQQKTLFSINSDGTMKKQLTFDKNIFFPIDDPKITFRNYISWSPDGENIAFISKINEIYTLNIINKDGLNEKTFKITEGNIKNFEWSHDGSKLIVNCTKKDSQSKQINYFYIVDKKLNILQKISSEPYDIDNVHWSPKENSFMYLEYVKNDIKLHIINCDKSNEEIFILPYVTNYLNWSPDGENFVTNIFAELSQPKIYIINKDGSEKVSVSNKNSNNDYQESFPKWFK